MIHYKTKILSFLLMLLFCSMTFRAASAQSILRDSEIESDLRQIASPIFTAAGLNPTQVRLILINDNQINAFVAGGQNMFLYSGLILEAKNVGQLAGVMAHESGHIAGGHLMRMRDAMERASLENIVSTVLGIAVGIGAGSAEAGAATVIGGGELAGRRLLKHSRVLESSADQAGMAALERAGYSSQDMADFLGILASQEVLPEMQRSSYVLTHPMSRERLQTVESFVARSRNKNKPWPPAWEESFRRMQAKILGFTSPHQALTRYANDNSTAGRYARAIATYRTGKISDALTQLATLEKEEPKNGFFAELRGQILFEQGRIPESIAAYTRAVELEPQQGLIHFSLAQALLQNEKGDTNAAIAHLIKAREYGERDMPLVYRWLAVAYGRQGKEGLAKLSLAEEALLKGDYGFAITQAKRADDLLANDAAARQRARDITTSANRAINKKK